MERIAIAGNIIPPIFHLILEKGYKIEVEGKYLVAKKNDIEIIANDIVELAGIILLRENKGENWKVNNSKIDEYLNFINKRMKK